MIKMEMRMLQVFFTKLQFIDSARFITSSSSDLVDNLAEGFYS